MNHLIHRQIVELQLRGGGNPFSLQHEVSRMCREDLPRILEQVFDELAPGSAHYRLERLEIDLGVIHGSDLEQELRIRVREALQVALRRTRPVAVVVARSGAAESGATLVSEPQAAGVEVLSAETSDELLLREFLETGLVPWWAGAVEGAELEARFVRLLEHRTGPVLAWLRGHGGAERIVRRLLGQFSQPTSLTLLRALAQEAHVDATLAVLLEVAPPELPASRWRHALVEALLPVMLAPPRDQPFEDTMLALAVEVAMELGADAAIVRETWSRHVPSAPALWAPPTARNSSGRTGPVPGTRTVTPAAETASLPPERQVPGFGSPPEPAPGPHVESGDTVLRRKEAIPAREPSEAPHPPPLVSNVARKELAEDSPRTPSTAVPSLSPPRGPGADAAEQSPRVPPPQVNEGGGQLSREPLQGDAPAVPSNTAREELAEDSPRTPSMAVPSFSPPRGPGADAAEQRPRVPPRRVNEGGGQLSREPLQGHAPAVLPNAAREELAAHTPPRGPVAEASEQHHRVPPPQVDEGKSQLPGEPLQGDAPAVPPNAATKELAEASPRTPTTKAPARSTPRMSVPDATESPRRLPPAQVKPGTVRQTGEHVPGARLTSAALEAQLKFGLSVENAGVVILHPFLRTFFEAVGLIEGKSFRDFAARCRAVCLLQWLVHEDGAEDEHRMALSKVLCGIPLEEVVPRLGGPTEAERAEGEQLLQHVVAQWAVIKSTSTRGLREAFLQRKGLLRRDDNGWMLRLETRPYDMLLERLPWGVSHIRLSWMTSLLRVER